ncbi:MAG TPA: TonB-dependent receptor [Candidatus Binatia bacterium]|nr:TonB-dependent receptor [Candidatus Binatia bacterium]
MVRLAVILLVAVGVVRAEPVPLDEVVVTADRVPQRVSEVPASVTVLTRAEIERTAALTTDDLLRRIPGFNLFRRASSLVANPTAQGVSLRGLGGSGASRTLVLVDGVPLNDPFGGWVAWSRVPLESIERVEVVRGPSATVWGNYAMGGVINIITAKPERRGGVVSAEGGNHDTVRADGRVTDVHGPVAVGLWGSWLATGGYPTVRADQRGRIDVPPDAARGVGDGRIEYRPRDDLQLHLHANGFTEERGNGTPLTDNSTDAGDVDTGVRWRSADGSNWTLLGYGRVQRFASRFSTQADDRDSERPALDQFDVPATAAGLSAQWVRAFGTHHRLSGGIDGSWITGETDENARFQEGRFRLRREIGAEQQFAGAWAQWAVRPVERFEAVLGGRVDGWRSLDGFRDERALPTGIPDNRPLPSRDDVVFDPTLALRWSATDALDLRAAGYRGWRAPTINELVRPFRVRNDITEANPTLRPERLGGGEVGADWVGERVESHLTAFWTVIDDPIANVTVGSGPGDVAPCGFVPDGGRCRQRQNLGANRVRGIESEVEVQPWPAWTLRAGQLLSDADVMSAPDAPGLVGKRVAQVPRIQAVLRASYAPATGPVASVQVRYVGQQYEDDKNTLSLGGYAVVDVFLGWRFSPRVEAFVGIENAFDRVYPVGRSGDGLSSIGAPILAHGGVRARF